MMKILPQNNNQPSFKANIRVLGGLDDFAKLPLSLAKSVSAPWTVSESMKILDDGFTEDMVICTAGYIQNGKTGLLFHLSPLKKANTEEAVHKTFNDYIQKLKELKEGGENLGGFITGGKAESLDSNKLYQLIKNIFEKNKIQFSSIWGSKLALPSTDLYTPVTDLYVSAAKQEYVINANLRSGVFVNNAEDLKKVYEEVIIHPQDTLVFN